METLLTAFGDNDLTYTSIFLSTYRAFTSTQAVLQLLLDRWACGGVFDEMHGQEVVVKRFLLVVRCRYGNVDESEQDARCRSSESKGAIRK